MEKIISDLKSVLSTNGSSSAKKNFLPNVQRLEEVFEGLLDVMFPGFRCQFDSFEGRSEVCPIEQTLGKVRSDLVLEVSKAFSHQAVASNSNVDDPDYAGRCEPIVDDFLRQIPSIRVSLQADAEAAFDGDPACKDLDEVVLCYPGFFAIAIYRLSHQLLQLNVPLIPRIISEWAHRKTGIDIHPGAKIGSRFFIDHGTGVVIGETCRIGNNVKIYQGVTLGALSFPRDEEGSLRRDVIRHPKIEDDVVLYANSTVLGGNTVIGAGAVIGSSTWITESVAPGQVVVMESPKLKVRNQLPDHFVNNYMI